MRQKKQTDHANTDANLFGKIVADAAAALEKAGAAAQEACRQQAHHFVQTDSAHCLLTAAGARFR